MVDCFVEEAPFLDEDWDEEEYEDESGMPLDLDVWTKRVVEKLKKFSNAEIKVSKDFGKENSMQTKMTFSSEDKRTGGIASFTLWYFPGCCKYCILTGVARSGVFYDSEVIEILIQAAMDVARYHNYTKMVVTDVSNYSDGLEKLKAFYKFGFREIDSGPNRNSGNKVHMLVKEMDYSKDSFL